MSDMTRRRFLGGSAGVGTALALPGAAVGLTASPLTASELDALAADHLAVEERARQPLNLVLRVNGVSHRLAIDARTTLLDALREQLGLTGSKKGCDHGQCGACTVTVDGRSTLGCLTLAAMVGDRAVRTIEGLASGETLHPMQQAFIDHDAFQCGYCTPGQIMAAVACVETGHAENPAAIREFMSGNLCRCAAYPNIVAAIEQARNGMRETVA